jgi:hypothetical protein
MRWPRNGSAFPLSVRPPPFLKRLPGSGRLGVGSRNRDHPDGRGAPVHGIGRPRFRLEDEQRLSLGCMVSEVGRGRVGAEAVISFRIEPSPGLPSADAEAEPRGSPTWFGS